MLFKNLGIEPDNSKASETLAQALDKAQIMPYNGNELVNQGMYSNGETNSDDDDSKDHFDVAFIVGEVGYDKSQLEGICSEIKAISEIIFERSNDVTISIYGLDGSGNTQSKWYGRADNIENVEVMLGKIEPKEIQNKNKIVTISDCIDYVTLAHKNTKSEEKRHRAEYGFLFFDPLYEELDGFPAFEYVGSSSRSAEYGMAVLETINRDGTDIAFSTITSYFQTIEERRTSYAKLLSYKTHGINIDGISFENVVQKSIEHIYGEVYSPTYEYSMGVLSTNWKEVKLKAPITYKYYDLSTRDDLTIDDIEIYDCVDTDEDGLYDFQEIMFRYNGRDTMIFESTEDDAEIVKLFSLSEFSTEKSKDTIYQLPVYVENALLGMDKWGKEYEEFITTPLIFIYSDPTSGDGDGDGVSDPEDIMPLVTLNYKSTKFSEFVDTAEFFEIRFILECQLMKGYTADECVDCIEILRKYKDTNDVASFQQEMISAGLVSPDAAAPVTWFDKIFWGAWAENKSAPLLNEYENYSKNTSFEELFEQSAEQWLDTCKIAFDFWIFGVAEQYANYMQNWHKISCVPEDYNFHFNFNDLKECKSIWWYEGYVDDLSNSQILFGVKTSPKGLSTLGSATKENAMSAGKAWVGKDYKVITDKLGNFIGYSSSDGMRAFRIQYKHKEGIWRANYQQNMLVNNIGTNVGQHVSELKNVHIDILN